MDKQRDFEKGWEEYKAEKKQEIEEIGQDIADICSDMALNCCGNTPCYACIAKRLERKGYRKIPENAVVLTREEYENLGLFVETVQEYESQNGQPILVKEKKVVKKSQTDFVDLLNREIRELQISQQARKETAEKFAERLKAMAYQSTDWSHGEHPMVVEVDYIDEIAEEITEGKV